MFTSRGVILACGVIYIYTIFCPHRDFPIFQDDDAVSLIAKKAKRPPTSLGMIANVSPGRQSRRTTTSVESGHTKQGPRIRTGAKAAGCRSSGNAPSAFLLVPCVIPIGTVVKSWRLRSDTESAALHFNEHPLTTRTLSQRHLLDDLVETQSQ